MTRLCEVSPCPHEGRIACGEADELHHAALASVTNQRDGFARSFISLKALMLEGSLISDDREYEDWQARVAENLPKIRACEAEARRVLAEGAKA